MTMRKTYQIADYFIHSFQKNQKSITNMKLQKLLYYAQGFYLARYDKPLFDENFEAWAYGPVVPSQYYRFNEYDGNNITSSVVKPGLSKTIQDFLDEIINMFGDKSAYGLSEQTHKEKPWKIARGDLPEFAPSSNIISKEGMQRYFKKIEKRERIVNNLLSRYSKAWTTLAKM